MALLQHPESLFITTLLSLSLYIYIFFSFPPCQNFSLSKFPPAFNIISHLLCPSSFNNFLSELQTFILICRLFYLHKYIYIYVVQCYYLLTAVHFFSQHSIKLSLKNSKTKKRESVPKCLKPGFFINQLSLDPVYKLPSQISICYNVPGFGRL